MKVKHILMEPALVEELAAQSDPHRALRHLVEMLRNNDNLMDENWFVLDMGVDSHEGNMEYVAQSASSLGYAAGMDKDSNVTIWQVMWCGGCEEYRPDHLVSFNEKVERSFCDRCVSDEDYNA